MENEGKLNKFLGTISTKNYGDDGIFLSEDGFRKLLEDESTPIDRPLTDIEFIKWYSGMDEDKILRAYERYKKETKR